METGGKIHDIPILFDHNHIFHKGDIYVHHKK